MQAILVFEFLWSVLHVWLPFNVDAFQFSAVFIIPVLLYAIAPVVSWYLLKPILVKSKDKAVYSNAYKRLLYNPDVFNQLLQQQEDAAEGWQQLGITIGNPNATITILKVCNPYCGPCAKAHKVLEEIIHQNNNVKLTIIFTSTTNIEDRGLKPVQHLLAIYNKNNPSQMQQALDDWYLSEIQGYEIFAKKHPLNEDFLKYNNSINIMRKWCTVANITHTPTIFINGKKMPELYDIAALKNIF